MTTITVTINDSAAETIRQIARQRSVSVDDLFEQLITELDKDRQDAGRRACQALDDSFRAVSKPLGGKPWTTRDELYDR